MKSAMSNSAATTRNLDRLVQFTDAVVAIAITLLILPLVEVVTQSQTAGLNATQVVTEHGAQIFAFLLSFVVIARFWLGHHRLVAHVGAYTTWMMRVSLLWLLAIVVLPFPTEIVADYPASRFTAGFYIGVIFALSLCQSVLYWMVHGHPELERPEYPVSRRELVGAFSLTGLSGLAFLLAVVIPGVSYYALFLLFLAPVVHRFTDHRRGGAPAH
jgi:uncharacterized membrane protein